MRTTLPLLIAGAGCAAASNLRSGAGATNFFYITQPGDGCLKIQEFFGIQPTDIYDLESHVAPLFTRCPELNDNLYKFDRLQITNCVKNCDAAAVKVVSGDTCASIAKAHNTTPDRLFIKGYDCVTYDAAGNYIHVGDWIEILPESGPTPAPAPPTPTPPAPTPKVDLWKCSFATGNPKCIISTDPDSWMSESKCHDICQDVTPTPAPAPTPVPAPSTQPCTCIPCDSTVPASWSSGSCSPSSNACSATTGSSGCYTACSASCDCGSKKCQVGPTQLYKCSFDSAGLASCVLAPDGYLDLAGCQAVCTNANPLAVA
jgi:hypothetical protein